MAIVHPHGSRLPRRNHSPVIVPAAASGTSEAAAYAWGVETASALATAFPSLTWEVGNELDMYAVLPGTTGQSTSDYNDAIYAIVRGSIRGMSNGIHQADPTASVAVGVAGLHFGFLQRLANDGVSWEITSEHYYAPPGSTHMIETGADFLFSTLAQFGKPIVMTEFNQQQGSLLSQSRPSRHPRIDDGRDEGLSATVQYYRRLPLRAPR